MTTKGDHRFNIPTRKPRKRKNNPTRIRIYGQKAAKDTSSQIRIFIQHAIGGMKRYNIWSMSPAIAKLTLRMKAVGICAGLVEPCDSLLRNNSMSLRVPDMSVCL